MPRMSLAVVLLVGCKPEPATDAVDTDLVAPVRQETRAPFSAPEDPLGPGVPESCAVIGEARCDGGDRFVCAPFDVGAGTFPDSVDPLVERALWYDRWVDLYHSPGGVIGERSFSSPMEAGTDEAVWGALEHFAKFDGVGDGTIWTAISAHAAMLRWLSTGTAADRARFEGKVRDVVRLFDVTGIPGYAARYHYVAGAAANTSDEVVVAPELSSDNLPVDPGAPDLPAAYTEGLDAAPDATLTPMWRGNPSIDQYTGPMVLFPAAWSLLDDEPLKARVATHMTCYLKRLRRIDIVNVSQSPLAEELLPQLLGFDSDVTSDPDSALDTLDTVTVFVHPRIHPGNADDFDRSCPDDLSGLTTAWRTYDGADPTFVAQLLGLAADATSMTPEAIDHFYVPGVRGGDAVHLTHLAAMAWHMTGDEAYRDFLHEELLATLDTARVANTLAALIPPEWCRAHYGDHITVPPLWALLNLLEDSPLRDELLRALDEEAWTSLSSDLGNAKFMLLVADHLDARASLGADAMTLLGALGGNGGVLLDPRRRYPVDEDDVTDFLDGRAVVCPTALERSTCEDGVTIAGQPFGGSSISYPCDGRPWSCELGDGTCADAHAPEALPPELRKWSDFIWQRNPFEIPDPSGTPTKQSAGLDLTEPFWLARVTGATGAGAGVVLAWQPDGACDAEAR